MNEEFLQYVWRFKNFSFTGLQTTGGEEIKLFKAGEYNTNAGPDFLNARIQIGEVQWAGSVEIHVKTSHWDQHGHSADPAYNNVILHVVYENDTTLENSIPILELKSHISPSLWNNYLALRESRNFIPCQDQLAGIDEFIRSNWLERIIIERLESKTDYIQRKLESLQGEWRETFYQVLARNFGFKVNADAFERLAETLPMRVLAKHRNSLFQLEALLFGQAGLLEDDFADDFPKTLKKEFSFLRKKYDLQPLPPSSWKFMRMRPDNFPTCRISQFAGLVYSSDNLFSAVLEFREAEELFSLFETEASTYWDSHYTFGKVSAKTGKKTLGRQSIENILINTVIPIIYTYGRLRGKTYYKEKALQLLEVLPPENNSVLQGMISAGFETGNAARSQSLLHLKKEYCDKRKCLSCTIGIKIVRNQL